VDNVVVEVEPGDLIPTSTSKGAGPGTSRAAYPWRVVGPRVTRPPPPPAGREQEKSLPHHPKKGGYCGCEMKMELTTIPDPRLFKIAIPLLKVKEKVVNVSDKNVSVHSTSLVISVRFFQSLGASVCSSGEKTQRFHFFVIVKGRRDLKPNKKGPDADLRTS
jgi:hypothetical protein